MHFFRVVCVCGALMHVVPTLAREQIVVTRQDNASEVERLPDAADGRFRSRYLNWSVPDAEVISTSLRPALGSGLRRISSRFGYRGAPLRGASTYHQGLDLPGTAGTPVFASADGLVTRAGWAGGYGNLVEIRHGDNIVTRYGHLSTILVSAFASVRQGQEIGLMGSTGRSTGSHLHFEIRLDGRAVDPLSVFASGERFFVNRIEESQEPRISAFAAARAASRPVVDAPPTSLFDLRPTPRPERQLP